MRRVELHDLDPVADGRGCRTRLEQDSPWFAGHFPDRPILPAIAQLGFVMSAESRCSDTLRSPAAFGAVRFLDRVEPGAELELLVAEPDAEGQASFAVKQKTKWISRGRARWRARTENADSAEAGQASDDDPSWNWDGGIDAEALLPHGTPARLIQSVRSGAADRLDALARIPAANPFVVDGFAPTLIALELAAQAAAALEALGRMHELDGTSSDTGTVARQGYLVSAKNVVLNTDTIAAGAAVRVRIRLGGQALPLSLYDFRVAVNGLEQASGTVGTYLA